MIVESIALASIAANWCLWRKIKELSICPVFGIKTRASLDEVKQYRGFVLFIDIDDLHNINADLGYAEADKRIRAALAETRKSDLVVGRWYSGDEFAVLTNDKTQPILAANRIGLTFRKQGLSVSIGVQSFTGNNWKDAVATASALVQKAKLEDAKGTISTCLSRFPIG